MAGMGVKEARDWAAEKLCTANGDVVRDLLATVKSQPKMEALAFYKANECSIVLTDLMLTVSEYDREQREWIETEPRELFDEDTTLAYKLRAYQNAVMFEVARVSDYETEEDDENVYWAGRRDRLMDARQRAAGVVEEPAERF